MTRELIDAVVENSKLTSAEKETIIQFAQVDEIAEVYTKEAGLTRRLLQHPEFEVEGIHVVPPGSGCKVIAPEDFSEGDVTGVEGTIPVGALKIQKRSRSTSQHARIVSESVLR